MSGLVFFLLDLGEWLGKSLTWLAEDSHVLVGCICVLFVILVVLAGALQAGFTA